MNGNTTPKASSSVARLPLLDVLRTIAALGVLLFHAPELFAVPLFQRGYLFVDLFFLISGFVLALSAEPNLNNGLSAFSFVRARVRRLWPMMALGSVAGAVVFATQAPVAQILELLVLSLFFIPLLTDSPTLYPLNAPQWSLLWELVANLVHGLLLRRLSDKGLLVFAAACGVGLSGAIVHVGCNCFGPNVHFGWLTGLRVGYSYTMGVWMARKWSATKPRPVTDWRLALALPVLIVVVLSWLPVAAAIGDAVAVIAVLPALFWIVAVAKPPSARLHNLQRIGALSFPIYAINMPVVIAFTFWNITPLSRLAAVTITLLAAVLISRGAPVLLSYWRQVRFRPLPV
jgi:peptidoglycan/LPS O-acetylase OafA/YrhL